ncbi:MAG: hypothetical protein KDB01_14670 [Planctomycetaceae bacterium]|nr:hypothetical protein [Planctomycetaceae bacterium]
MLGPSSRSGKYWAFNPQAEAWGYTLSLHSQRVTRFLSGKDESQIVLISATWGLNFFFDFEKCRRWMGTIFLPHRRILHAAPKTSAFNYRYGATVSTAHTLLLLRVVTELE